VEWQAISVDTDPDEAWLPEDPAEILTALAGLLEQRPAWHRRAACRGQVAAFFPTRGESADEAKAICSGCPVKAECAAAGLSERHGIWAGMSERQRRAARRTAA
jgi:WhiB family redox-sensing transcriptional regulator